MEIYQGSCEKTLQVMMTAGVDRHRQGQPDAVSIRLWKSYEDDLAALARLVYAPDGCSWTGDDCTDELWTGFWYCSNYSLEYDMLHDCNGQPIPEDLRDWEQASTELGITQAQRPENPLKEPSVFELMAQIAAPSGSVGERERLEENFEDIMPKIGPYCPDLEGSMQVGNATVYVWQLLADAGTQVELTDLTAAFLSLAGTTHSLTRNRRQPEHTCGWLLGFLYLLMTEQGLSMTDAHHSIVDDYLFPIYFPEY